MGLTPAPAPAPAPIFEEGARVIWFTPDRHRFAAEVLSWREFVVVIRVDATRRVLGVSPHSLAREHGPASP